MKTSTTLAILGLAAVVGTTAGAFIGVEWSANFRNSDGLEASSESALIMTKETAKAGGVGAAIGTGLALALTSLINSVDKIKADTKVAKAKAEIRQLQTALRAVDMNRVLDIETEIKERDYAD